MVAAPTSNLKHQSGILNVMHARRCHISTSLFLVYGRTPSIATPHRTSLDPRLKSGRSFRVPGTRTTGPGKSQVERAGRVFEIRPPESYFVLRQKPLAKYVKLYHYCSCANDSVEMQARYRFAENRQGFSHREADEKSPLDEAIRRGIGGAGRGERSRRARWERRTGVGPRFLCKIADDARSV